MQNIDRENSILLFTSKNDKLELLIKRNYLNFHFVNQSDLDSGIKPNIIISECNRNCNVHVCMKKAFIAIYYPTALYVIARPILADKSGHSRYGYWISYMNKLNSNEHFYHMFFRSISSIHQYSKILHVQRMIIEASGIINKISDINNIENKLSPYFIIKYKKLTGKSLKEFHKRIFMCHALHSVLLTNDPIKKISNSMKRHYNAFTYCFKRRFGLSPSNIRKIRDETVY